MRALAGIFCILASVVSHASTQSREPEPLFPVFQGGKLGYIDRAGRIVIRPQFEGAGDFREGRACVQLPAKSKYSLIDRQGDPITSAEFSECGAFSEGLAAVAFDTERTRRNCADCDPFYHWGYVNQNGALVINPGFHRALEFSEGLAAVQNEFGKWAFIDKTGRFVTEFQFDFVSRFSDGLAAVALNRKYMYIDHGGRQAIQDRFNDARDFSEGLALVRSSGDFFNRVGAFSGTNSEEEFLYIDNSGAVKIRLRAVHARGFSEGLAAFEVIKADGYLYCGYIDKSGEESISPRFGGCDDFSEGLASVRVSGKWHFIDKTGKSVIEVPAFQVQSFRGGLASFSGRRFGNSVDSGYIDKTGKVVWPR